jgi:hypothetical protein
MVPNLQHSVLEQTNEIDFTSFTAGVHDFLRAEAAKKSTAAAMLF